MELQTEEIRAKVTKTEKAQITANAKKANLTISAYIRQQTLCDSPLKELVAEMKKTFGKGE